MANEADPAVARGWRTSQVYAMATICLVVGLALGYLFRGSASRSAQPSPAPQSGRPTGIPSGTPQMPSLEEMSTWPIKRPNLFSRN